MSMTISFIKARLNFAKEKNHYVLIKTKSNEEFAGIVSSVGEASTEIIPVFGEPARSLHLDSIKLLNGIKLIPLF